MLRHVTGGTPGSIGHPDEASETAPGPERGMLERQLDALSRHSLQRLLALEEPAAPLLIDQGDGEPTWFQQREWRVLSAQAASGQVVGQTIERFRRDDGAEAFLSHDSSGKVYAPFDLAAAYDAYVSERSAGATRQRKLSARQLNAFYRVKRVIPVDCRSESAVGSSAGKVYRSSPRGPSTGVWYGSSTSTPSVCFLRRENRKRRFAGSGRGPIVRRWLSRMMLRARKVCVWRLNSPISRKSSDSALHSMLAGGTESIPVGFAN